MAVDGGVPRGRLSLLLFDSAAETLLRATAATQMLRAEMAARYSAVDPAGSSGPGDEWKKAGTLSARQRKQIEREFNALVDYVFAQENWPLSGSTPTASKCSTASATPPTTVMTSAPTFWVRLSPSTRI